jgi:hypothetical protein
MNDKYNRNIKGVTVDVYDVLKVFDVTCPALQHLIKKALCAGLRGHKNRTQDLQDIVDSALRAQCLDKDDAVQRQHEALIAESEQMAKGLGFISGGFIVNNAYIEASGVTLSTVKSEEDKQLDDRADSLLACLAPPFNELGKQINIAGDVTINITNQPEEVQHITGPTTESINELIRDSIKTACKPGGVIHNR